MARARGERDPLGLPARQLAGTVAGVIGQPDPLQPRRGSGPGLGLGDAGGAQAEGDVLQRAQVVEQQVVLEDDGHRSLLGPDERVGRGVVEHLTIEGDAAVVDRQQPGEAAEQRALARAVGSEDGDRFARVGRDVDVQFERAEAAADARLEAHRCTLPVRKRKDGRRAVHQ